MRGESPLGASLHGLFAVICTIAVALALGAVWMALTLHVPSARWWFAVPAGIIMGYAARAWITQRRAWATALAVAGMVLTAVYMKCLYAGLLLATALGLGLVPTLERAGAGMLLALARASLEPRFVVATLVGMALAGWVAWHRRKRAPAGSHPVP